MKIIAKKSYNKFIVEINLKELECILSNPTNTVITNESFKRFIDEAIGKERELSISDFHKMAIAINKLALKNRSFDRARKSLEEMLEALTPAENLIDKMNKKIKN